MDTHLAFSISRNDIRNGILIPKYYDPELDLGFETAKKNGFETVALRELLAVGDRGSQLGSWIRREHYGSGDIPYVRTSDISQWRIRTDYKKGVSQSVYDQVRKRQDIEPYDLLFVAHGTYLVGNVGIVMPDETKLVLQDHVFRLRCDKESAISPLVLLALMSTKFVRRQVRSKQFSADIIDKIGYRHEEIVVPIPRNRDTVKSVETNVTSILDEQTRLREAMKEVSGSNLRMTRERADARLGFSIQRSKIRSRIFIPKYYDPELERDLQEAQMSGPWTTISKLVSDGVLEVSTGVEVGKLAYGTGDIPFVRTSDIAEWEIKRDVKQDISSEIHKANEKKAGLAEKDVLLVRDGTYLVGSSAIVMAGDLPALICGGMFRLRADQDKLNPFALLGVLNFPVVRRQMRSKQFTRDVIDTLGPRFLEVMIPDLSTAAYQALGERVEEIMSKKAQTKSAISSLVDGVEPPVPTVAAGRPAWSMR